MLSEFYITRDSCVNHVKVTPAHIGISKYKGCIYYESARRAFIGGEMYLPLADCEYIFGFVPEPEEAWLVEGRKKTKIDLAFSI